MLPRRERPGITAVPLERDEAALAREHVRLVRLQLPERTQPHGVDADDAQVAEPREEGGGPLGERAERRARARERVLRLLVHSPHLVDDRREHELDRLDRIEPMTEDEPAHRRVHVLRVAPPARQRDAKRPDLVTEAGDRVDLAVVRERRERLHPLEAGRRIRGVAVVTEGHRRPEARIGEIRVVRGELLRMAAQLVDGRAAREADDRRRGQPLDLDARAVQPPTGTA